MNTNFGIFSQKEWYFRKYDGRCREFKGISKEAFYDAQKKAIHRRFIRSEYNPKSLLRRCYEEVVYSARPENGNYQKVVMYGNTWLYLCSPIYGHKDYNKARLMPIACNEKECEFLIRVSNRVSQNTLS